MSPRSADSMGACAEARLPEGGLAGAGRPTSKATDAAGTRQEGAQPLLSVRGLEAFYGRVQALRGISFDVHAGEIVTLIGGNGAGKTTTLAAVTALLPNKRGEIRLHGEEVSKLAPHELVRRGIAHVPEGRRVFVDQTILENLELGGYTVRDRGERHARIEQMFELFPRLAERARQLAGTMSGGEQQMLAVARALMQAPKVLLLDEPSMGLSPLLVEKIFDTIVAINKAGTTVVLVEQNAHMALGIAHRAYVLRNGEITREGRAADLIADDRIRAAYLGAD
jgi:branched-chain amino acid transport system ATP-binding protein